MESRASKMADSCASFYAFELQEQSTQNPVSQYMNPILFITDMGFVEFVYKYNSL